jgi:hypothetical protein
MGLNLLKFSKARTRTKGRRINLCLSGTWSNRYATYLNKKANISMDLFRVSDSPMTSWASWKMTAFYSLACDRKL